MGLLFKRYHRPLFGFLFHMTSQREASEDMVQNVFYRMLKSRHTFTGNGEFKTWMYHLARNVLKDHTKKNKRSAAHYDISEFAERIAGGITANEGIEKNQESGILQNALANLKLLPIGDNQSEGLFAFMGLCCWNAELFNESKLYFQRALAINPEDYISNFYYAMIQHKVYSDFERAEKHYEIALNIYPDSIEAQYNCALLFALMSKCFYHFDQA